jgi:threonine/homoserine/homoserine lactone efflux protein
VAFVVSLVLTSAAGLALGAAGSRAAGDTSTEQSSGSTVVLVGLAILLLAVGVQNLRNRADESEPAVLASIRGMGPGPVAVLALGATLLNPKNLPLLLAAGATLAGTSAPVAWSIAFLAVATVPYWASTLYARLGGQAAESRLDAMRGWLTRRNRLIMGVLCTALAIVILGKELAG